jgi:hypothetical protein
MAKGAYIGVNGVAKKIKKGYVGVTANVPIYEEQDVTATINTNNILDFFTETIRQPYHFVGDGSVFTTNNGGVNGSEAMTKLEAKYDMDISFNYSYSSEKSYDKFTLVVAGNTIENEVSGETTNKSWSGKLTKGQTILFTYKKDGSGDKNDDKCTFSNMVVSTKKIVQVGTEQKEIARRIKKAYIGIGGVARPCWSGGELAYYGTITSLSKARHGLAATAVGDYALFAGGKSSDSSYGKTVDAYNKSLTRITAPDLTDRMINLTATTVGNYALFGCGGSSVYVTAYDSSLTTKSLRISLILESAAATTVGDYALFGGGGYDSNGDPEEVNNVFTFDKSLTMSEATRLSQTRRFLAATTVGDYALFGGGCYWYSDTYYSLPTVDAYNKSLTRTDAPDLTDKEMCDIRFTATTVGNHALFAACYPLDYQYITDTYDASLTKSTFDGLSVIRDGMAATTVGDYALFAGGYKLNDDETDYADSSAVDAYDIALTHTVATHLALPRCFGAATTIGDYALFGGGGTNNDGGYTSTVDVYVV